MKKILILLLAFILPAVAGAFDAKIDGIYYDFNKDAKTATVTALYYDSRNQDAYSGTVNIPPTVDYGGETYDVTSIGYYAFRYCSGLTSVTIPSSVTSIGYYAFSDCSGLTSVTIPDGVTSIGESAFSGCSGLTSVTIPNSVTSIEDGTFSYCSGLTSVTIPDSVTSIESWTFFGCSGLTSVTIPGSVTSIGDGAFRGCSGLTSVTIPNGITTINKQTFGDCSSMESLKLPETLTIIRNSAFKGCRALKSVTIPSTVEFIYEEAFAGCTGLESVKAMPETPPFLYESSFSNYNIPLYAPKTAIAAYQAKEPWSKFAQFLTLDGQEVEMPQCATPTIDYANWKLTFSCETKDAKIVTKAVCSDSQEGDGGSISLMPTYTITAYARAEGYRDSDVATATIGWKNGRPVIISGFSNVSLSDHAPNCDANLDGNIDVADIATIIDAMAGKSREERTE